MESFAQCFSNVGPACLASESSGECSAGFWILLPKITTMEICVFRNPYVYSQVTNVWPCLATCLSMYVLVAGRDTGCSPSCVCHCTGCLKSLSLCFLIGKLRHLKWWFLRPLSTLNIPLFNSLNQFVFLFFICDSYKARLLLHKGDKREKIQTSISAAFWLTTRWQFLECRSLEICNSNDSELCCI